MKIVANPSHEDQKKGDPIFPTLLFTSKVKIRGSQTREGADIKWTQARSPKKRGSSWIWASSRRVDAALGIASKARPTGGENRFFFVFLISPKLGCPSNNIRCFRVPSCLFLAGEVSGVSSL